MTSEKTTGPAVEVDGEGDDGRWARGGGRRKGKMEVVVSIGEGREGGGGREGPNNKLPSITHSL